MQPHKVASPATGTKPNEKNVKLSLVKVVLFFLAFSILLSVQLSALFECPDAQTASSSGTNDGNPAQQFHDDGHPSGTYHGDGVPIPTLAYASLSPLGFPALVAEMFPHVQHCGYVPNMQGHWILDYAQRHEAIRLAVAANGGLPSDANADEQRLLVSIPHLSGTADQVISLVSQFYLAVLSNRAFTQYSPEGRPPPIAAACDSPFFNWTHPVELPPALLEPLPSVAQQTTTAKPIEAAAYQAPFDTHFAFHLMVNPVKQDLELMRTANLTDFPAGKSNISTVISTSNRGVSYRMMNNPNHKQQIWRKYHLRPETAFMCGFWSLCSPNAAVQQLYADKYWRPMSQTDVLKIGIQIRLGDDVAFLKNKVMSDEMKLKAAAPYFACATLLEQAFAKQGQHVIWFLLSDSASVRKAAQKMYPGKVLTNDEVPLVHVACGRNDDPSLCTDETLTTSIQNAIGEMLTFSLADYHIISQNSGFGRVGAWLSGNWKHIYTLRMGAPDAAKVCPSQPSSPDESAEHFSGI